MKNKEEDKEENPPGILNDFIETAEKNIERDVQSYDICEIRDLLYYEPGDKLKPVLEETCIKYITFYKKVCEEEHFADLMKNLLKISVLSGSSKQVPFSDEESMV